MIVQFSVCTLYTSIKSSVKKKSSLWYFPHPLNTINCVTFKDFLSFFRNGLLSNQNNLLDSKFFQHLQQTTGGQGHRQWDPCDLAMLFSLLPHWHSLPAWVLAFHRWVFRTSAFAGLASGWQRWAAVNQVTVCQHTFEGPWVGEREVALLGHSRTVVRNPLKRNDSYRFFPSLHAEAHLGINPKTPWIPGEKLLSGADLEQVNRWHWPKMDWPSSGVGHPLL